MRILFPFNYQSDGNGISMTRTGVSLIIYNVHDISIGFLN